PATCGNTSPPPVGAAWAAIAISPRPTTRACSSCWPADRPRGRPAPAPLRARPKDSHGARVKRAGNAQQQRRHALEQATGHRGQRSRLYRKAKEQVLHSQTYNFRDRKKRKGNFRQLWIQRINAAARANGMTYNRLIQGLGLAGVEVDRRMLAELAVNDAPAFAALVEVAKNALPEDVNAPAA